MRHLPLFTSAALSSESGEQKIRVLLQQIDRRMNSPLTSSCGRLFDGVSALLGLCPSISFEGQAAMELEMIADLDEGGAYEFFTGIEDKKEMIRLGPMFEGILQDLEKGIDRFQDFGEIS